eukprot:scaffold3221_cov118-Isochrysis_galbana.AAC.4
MAAEHPHQLKLDPAGHAHAAAGVEARAAWAHAPVIAQAHRQRLGGGPAASRRGQPLDRLPDYSERCRGGPPEAAARSPPARERARRCRPGLKGLQDRRPLAAAPPAHPERRTVTPQ